MSVLEKFGIDLTDFSNDGAKNLLELSDKIYKLVYNYRDVNHHSISGFADYVHFSFEELKENFEKIRMQYNTKKFNDICKEITKKTEEDYTNLLHAKIELERGMERIEKLRMLALATIGENQVNGG